MSAIKNHYFEEINQQESPDDQPNPDEEAWYAEQDKDKKWKEEHDIMPADKGDNPCPPKHQ